MASRDTDVDTEAETNPRIQRPQAGTKSTDSVVAFLDRYARALTEGDTKKLASMWETPAFVIGDDGTKAVASSQEVERFFTAAKDLYNARGISDTRADILRLEWATDRIAIVDVRWPYIDAHGTEVGEESSTYTLRVDDTGAIKVRVTLMRGSDSAEH